MTARAPRTHEAVGGTAVSAVRVCRLAVTGFRSYGSARIVLDSRPAVISGRNGAGKTNLLEALSLLAPGRGLRRSRLDELVRVVGEVRDPVWSVSARVEGVLGPVELATGQDLAAQGAGERRQVVIDGIEVRSQARLGDHVATVWLVPQMDRLFHDGAAERRSFVDRLALAIDPAHAGRVTAYRTALRERVRVLRERPGDRAWVTALEETIAARGSAIAAARLDLVRRLERSLGEAVGVFPRARVRLAGDLEEWLAREPALAAEDRFREALAGSRITDAETGTTAVGPHRTDLEVSDADRGMPAALCSTGEQKALLISLVLASTRMVAAQRGIAPLLLLDEVVAHLDPKRRAALFEEIVALGVQAWLTGTDPELFAPLGEAAQHLCVEDGVIRRLDS